MTIICRLCGNGPCVSEVAKGDTCPWSILDQPKKSFQPDPRPVKAQKGKRK